MIYVVNDSDNPFFNHAIEEYIIKNIEEDAFILWKNRPSILIGRNQNTLTEIDYEYVRQEKIDVVRRLSGGGTVFNDLGNINFTFITKKAQDGSSLSNGFEKFALPVIKALQSLGVNAVFTGRNDITIDEKKFSGNAQYHYKDKTLHHGTLLFSGNLERLAKALKSKPLKLQDKGVKSVRSRVTNISEHLKSPMNVIEFKEYLKKYIMDFHNITEEYVLSENEMAETIKIQKERFESWDWNYGKSPGYNYAKTERFPWGIIEILVSIENGLIKEIKFYGDFFGDKSVEELENILTGMKYDKKEILEKLRKINVDNFIKGASFEEIASVIGGE
ncbi:MAG: lipoate--protein ligase [Clostridia bacterium]|nr:lipoate--protein ligase [Clostridia bacterium]